MVRGREDRTQHDDDRRDNRCERSLWHERGDWSGTDWSGTDWSGTDWSYTKWAERDRSSCDGRIRFEPNRVEPNRHRTYWGKYLGRIKVTATT